MKALTEEQEARILETWIATSSFKQAVDRVGPKARKAARKFLKGYRDGPIEPKRPMFGGSKEPQPVTLADAPRTCLLYTSPSPRD